MLGDFITRGLVLILGYAYPAFECFKTVEKNKVNIDELQFWCQYWIIVATLTVFERIGDIFVSWLPMYGEFKLGLLIYLWYPKTKGTSYIYGTFLRPYIAKHETEIDRKMQEMRTRAWDFALGYCQNWFKMGQSTFFQMLQFLASQSSSHPHPHPQKSDSNYSGNGSPPAPPSTPSAIKKANTRQNSDKRRPQTPPPSSTTTTTTTNHSVFHSPQSNTVKLHLHGDAKFIHANNGSAPDSPTALDDPEPGVDHSLQAARLRLRRSSSKSLN